MQQWCAAALRRYRFSRLENPPTWLAQALLAVSLSQQQVLALPRARGAIFQWTFYLCTRANLFKGLMK